MKKSFCFARSVIFIIWTVALISWLMLGCAEKSTKQKTIVPVIKSVTVVPPTVQKGRSGVVDVVVVGDANHPLPGIRVSFAVDPATIGYCTPLIDTTDGNGRAGTVFTGTELGTATIQVSGEDAQAKTAQITVVSSPAGTTKYIEIEATPAWIRADGASTSIIKATIRDSSSTLVKDSTLVKFVAGEEFEDVDGDGYYTEGIDSLTFDTNQDGKWNAIGTITPYAFTQNGVAQVTYTAGFRTGDVYIKVTTNLEGQKIQEQSSILLIPTDSVAFIVLSLADSAIQVKGSGGMEATQITASCYDKNGNRVSKDFPVEFSITEGPGGGESLNGDTISPVTIKTNSYGEASVTLLSGTKSGSVILRAKVGSVFSTTTVVIVSGKPPGECSTEIEVIPSLLPADGNSTGHIKVTVKDYNGNPVTDSIQVNFAAGEKFEDVDGDGYYTEWIDSLVYDTNHDGKWNTIGTIEPYAFTHNGVAEVTYTSGLRTGSVYIKVTAGLACLASKEKQKECTILLTPTDSVAFIVLSPIDSIIQVKGSGGMEATQITASCYDKNGNRVGQDFPVEFAIIDGPKGGESLNGDTVNPVIINTNSYGEASVTLLSGTKSGSVILRAKVGNVFSTSTVYIISGGPLADCSLEIELIPSSLTADGISTSNIKVTIKNSNGNLVEDNTLVKFAAGEKFKDMDGDGYYTEWVDSLIFDTNHDGKWNAIGTITPYAFTHNGVAQNTYISGFRTGTVYIKVTANLSCSQKQKECTLLLTPEDTVAFVVLTPDRSSIQVKGTGGVEASQITAACYDPHGNRVGIDFPVEFYISSGPQGGENLNGEASIPVTLNTNSFGEAIITMLSGTKSGTVRLEAITGGVVSAATIVTICAGPPFDISLTPDQCNIAGCYQDCVEDSICACVVDRYGNTVPDSTSVYFGTEEGMVHCCDKTKKGCAYSLYVSGDPRNDCIALVWAETRGEDGIIRDTCTIILSGAPTSVTFLDYPHTILADGISKGHVLIEVLDVNNNFIVDSTPVAMYTVFGSVDSGVTKNGCDASLFQTELVSEVLAQDYSMKYTDRDDSVGVISVLTAKSGVVSTSVTVTFLTGNTYSDNCDISVVTIPVGAKVPVVVFVKDAYGNPLGGHHVVADQAHSWRGTITGSAYTDEYGQAVGFFFTADKTTGTGVIAFYDQDPTGGICIAFNVSIVP